MALELLGARDLDLVAHPFVIVHVYGVACGETNPWVMQLVLCVISWW